MAPGRFLPVAAVLALALALASPANAKELTRATLCGKHDACSVIRDRERLRLVPMGGAASVAVPPRQPYYLLTYTIEHGGRPEDLGVLYLPESNLLAANGVAPGEMVWLPIADPESARLLRHATSGIEPHPPSAVWPWPHGLKSTYRVIPDDEVADVPPSSARPPVRVTRQETGSSSVLPGVAVAIAFGLALAAAWLLLRRLAPHQARDEGRQALAR